MLTSNSSNVIMRNASTTSWCAITLRTVMTVVMRGRLSAKWLVCIVLSYLILWSFYLLASREDTTIRDL